jgi:hypothetical protein
VDVDVVVAQPAQTRRSLDRELLDDLNAPDPANEPAEHGRLIAEAGANL